MPIRSKILVTLALCSGALAPFAALAGVRGLAVGDQIHFVDREGPAGSGELGVLNDSGSGEDEYRTFLLSVGAPHDFDPAGFRVTSISINSPLRVIAPETAYLYTAFRNGTLSDYDYAPGTAEHEADALALQQAFWGFEDYDMFDIGTLAPGSQTLLWMAEAFAAVIVDQTWLGLGNVRVAATVWNSTRGQYADGDAAGSFLILVPSPAASAMGLWTLAGAGVCGLRRRRR